MLEADDLLGTTIAGKFEIEAVVGSGAMGHVYRARHTTLGTTVAIKIMRGDVAKDPLFRQRFLREAKAASRLEHPCSVRVLDYGEEADGMVYLAMEFLNGRDLLSVLRNDWPIADARIVEILIQTLSAVSVAHGLGIVHRDLKPENIMMTTELDDDGHVVDSIKVCDFGIAKMNDPRTFQTDGKSLTTSGMLIGTPEYMSPEQARGDPLDARSDLYSLAVVLYHLLTGRVPFTAENTIGIVLKQVTDEPEPPSRHRPGVNPRLEAICLKGLRKNREQRYQTAKEMRTDLRNVFGYRSATAQIESGPHVPPVAHARENLAIESAPTLRGGATSADPDFAPKQTSGGTDLRVPVTSHRGIVATVAGVAMLMSFIGAAVLFSALKKTPEPYGQVSAPPGSASEAPLVIGSGTAAMIDPSDPGTPTGPTSTSTTRITATGTALTTAIPTGSARAIASTHPSANPSLKASASTMTTAAPPTAEPTSSVPFRPSAANVSLGGLTTERVQKPPVSAWISGKVPKLTECYQSELMAIGSALGGSAQIALSIDDKGAIQAIVAAPKHPQFARCAQQLLAGQKIASSAVEPGGGTASQWLTLNP